ncbi:coiled-coil domain-containing protein [Mycoplasma amphoriforme]|uniref:Uncharacterized protein n=1 Tax=Mycoplasma amphoriforme A39 TaxID=572419 RepID=A0A292IIA3_9MOLU|nr:unnamed protein product [Mycoplasma amphoriforme A39]
MAKKDNDSEFQKLVLEQLKELAENSKKTTQSVQNIKTELKKEINKTNQKIDNTKIELKKEIDNNKVELKKEIDKTNEKVDKLDKKIDNTKIELKKEIDKTNEKVDKLNQKVDHGNAAINARIDSYHLPTDMPPPPVQKLYKLMKNIVLVHIDTSWNQHKLELLIKQIYQDFSHLKKKKVGYIQFRVEANMIKFVEKYLETIKFSKDYQYLIDHETDESKRI